MKYQDEKRLMAEAATLYYERRLTQQEVANLMGLSRQTVSKLVGDALAENIVQIKVHDPLAQCRELEDSICKKFRIDRCVVCSVSGQNETLRQMMTVKAASEYILPLISQGGLKIAVSWGRTVQALIEYLPACPTHGNTVFPLFGATDNESASFSPNELARSLADKLDAKVKCAWFPYLCQSNEDCRVLKTLSYYKDHEALWRSADLAIVGIGDREILEVFGKSFGYSDKHSQILGDIANHFFDKDGQSVPLYRNTLSASAEDLRACPCTVAVACGDRKAEAIAGALRTGLVNTLITDEHTARAILK